MPSSSPGKCGPAAAGASTAQGCVRGPPRRPRRESSLPAARASGRRERFLSCVGSQAVELRVGLAERLLDLFDRHVGVAAAVAQVLHVAAVVRVEGMEDRVAAPVELERLDAEPGAQREVEGGRGLHPAALEVQVGVAVIDEQVAAHGFSEPRRRKVVLHVGKAHARGNARRTDACGKQRGLAHAEALLGGEDRRRPEDFRLRKIEERVVADLVAYGVVKRNRALARHGTLGILFRESDNRSVGAVDVAPGPEEFLHLSSFIRRRAPWNSALDWLARPSTIEKWWVPGIAMSPANTARQRSPSSAFWR